MKKKKYDSQTLWEKLQDTKKPYEDLTLEALSDTLSVFYKGKEDDAFVRELTPQEIDWHRQVLGSFVFNSLGDRIFRLPGGGLTGIGGLKMFNEAVEKQLREYGR